MWGESIKYKIPSLTVDIFIYNENHEFILIQRKNPPFEGSWALPGGFVDYGEKTEDAAIREAKEETSIDIESVKLFNVYSDPNRDPRERVVTIAYYALVRMQEVKGGDDAAKAEWFALDKVPSLAFDHDLIRRVALKELRKQIHFEPIGFELLPEKFTIKELQLLYEAILDVKFDRRNFYNKMKHLEILTQLDETVFNSPKKEAYLFKFNPDKYEELKQKGFRLEF